EERGGGAERLAAGVDAAVQAADEAEDADGVEVVDGGGVGEVAHLRRVAGDDDEVPDAERVRAEEVRDLAEEVPVAAADVEERLDAELLLQAHREGEVRHPRLGAGAVCDVDDVDAAGGEHARGLDGGARVEADRGVDLDRDDEAAADLRGEGALLLAGYDVHAAGGGGDGRVRALLGGGADPQWAAGLSAAFERGGRGGAPLHAHGGGDAPHVIRR